MTVRKAIFMISIAVFMVLPVSAADAADSVWFNPPEKYMNMDDGITLDHMLPASTAIKENMAVAFFVGASIFFFLLGAKLIARVVRRVVRVEHYGEGLDTMVFNIGKNGKNVSVAGESRSAARMSAKSITRSGSSMPRKPEYEQNRKESLFKHIMKRRRENAKLDIFPE